MSNIKKIQNWFVVISILSLDCAMIVDKYTPCIMYIYIYMYFYVPVPTRRCYLVNWNRITTAVNYRNNKFLSPAQYPLNKNPR